MTEQFTIRDTEAGFAAWLQDYGEVSDPNGFSMYLSKGDAPNRDPWLVVYTSFGGFGLAIAKVAPGRLTATVDLGESVSDELKTYVAALAVAIRKKYKTETDPEPRGMNYPTEAKVREAHKRLKAGDLWERVKRVCTYETYTRWCLEVTGEEPILRQK